MNPTFSREDEAFRLEVRSWIERELPDYWHMPLDYQTQSRARREWDRKLGAAGFIGLSWPKEYGGRGESPSREAVLNEELARAHAPEQITVGHSLVAPSLLIHGTEEQKRRFIPPIAHSECIWCQGYSEPNSGSDLASLQTRGRVEGDELVINGRKIWTSYAMVADWVILLVRTDPTAVKHRGITCVLVPMNAPGVEIFPIRQLTGDDDFAETVYNDVRVPLANVVGEVNGGWKVVLTSLSFERSILGLHRKFLHEWEEIYKMGQDLAPAVQPVFASRMAEFYAEIMALRGLSYRILTSAVRGEPPGPESSIYKVVYSELHQRLLRTALDVQGPLAQLAPGAPGAVEGGMWLYRSLWSLPETIYGGTSEVQRNIIAERILGLPK